MSMIPEPDTDSTSHSPTKHNSPNKSKEPVQHKITYHVDTIDLDTLNELVDKSLNSPMRNQENTSSQQQDHET